MPKKKKLGLEGVEALWKRVLECMKTITGVVDTKKGTLQDQINKKIETDGDVSETKATFTNATNRTNISTGEKLGVMFGKIAKWLADLKTHSFSDLVQNATTAATDKAVSAAVAKNLQEQINAQNTNIIDGTYISAWSYVGKFSYNQKSCNFSFDFTAGTEIAIGTAIINNIPKPIHITTVPCTIIKADTVTFVTSALVVNENGISIGHVLSFMDRVVATGFYVLSTDQSS